MSALPDSPPVMFDTLHHQSIGNVDSEKHWWNKIQLFRLFRGENFGESPNNGKWILKIL